MPVSLTSQGVQYSNSTVRTSGKVGTARYALAAAGYGGDKAIFGYGYSTNYVSITNLVTNSGVVGTDVTGVGTARTGLAAASYSS
jgi:hypothetical protein